MEESRSEQKDLSGADTEVKEAQPEEEFGSEEHATAKYLADTFGEVKIYVEAGRDEAYVQLKEPQLHRFQLSEQENPKPEYDPEAFKPAEAHAIERWGQSEALHVDLVGKKEQEQFGKMQRDATTGEKYILLPVNIEFLIDPANLSPDTVTEYFSSYDQFKEVPLSCTEDKKMDKHTIHIPNMQGDQPEPAPAMDGESGEDPKLDQQELPKKEPRGTSSGETLRKSEDEVHFEYHMHEFKVPKFDIPFELNFASTPERKVEGADTDLETTAEPVAETESEYPDNEVDA